MAGFVLGTGPLFAALGFFLRSAAGLWQGRLTLATAVVVLLVAVWTLGSGLRLGGWWPTGDPAAVAAPEAARTVVLNPDGTQTVTIRARTNAYAPAAVIAKAGVPTTLVVATQGTGGCVRAFVIPDLGVQEILPTTGTTGIDLGARKPGTLEYSCGMGMYGGRDHLREPGGHLVRERMEFTVTGMHCTGCGLLIDDEVEELAGVVASATGVRAGRTVVDADRAVDPAAVIAAIAAAGYTAHHAP